MNTRMHIANPASDRYDCPLEHNSGSEQRRLAGCPSNLYMLLDCDHSIRNPLQSYGRVILQTRKFSSRVTRRGLGQLMNEISIAIAKVQCIS